MKWHILFLQLLFLYSLFAFGQKEDGTVIYVSSISWHTAIVVPGNTLPKELWQEGHSYAEVPYLEIGWGEADFYPHPIFNFWYAIKSVFWPTPSVLHVNPILWPVEEYYQNSEVVKITLNEKQLKSLTDFLTAAFARDKNGKVISAAKGFYENSHFYKGSESYFFPKNSNVWVARALKNAGLPISPFWYQTTGSVLNKASEFGELVVREQ